MKRTAGDISAVYLKPGRFYIADRPTVVTTVLGSCVSVTMFSRKFGVGAICHGLLPRCGEKAGCGPQCGDNFKYVDCSVRHMIERFRGLGIPGRDIEVKLFGGADMFSPDGSIRDLLTVGHQNVKTALSMMKDVGLPVLKADTGGTHGRKILFYTHTGDVLLKRLRKNEKEGEGR